MRALLTLAVLVTLVAVVSLGPRERPAPFAPGEVAARVNGAPVTGADVRRVRADLVDLYVMQGAAVGDLEPAAIEQEAIEMLIQRRLLLQEAERRDISVTHDDIDVAIVELRSRFADLAAFATWFEARGLDDRSLIDTIRGDLLVQRVTMQLADGANPTDQQVQDYYAKHRNDIVIGEEVRLGIITVDSVAESDRVLAALRDGAPFDQLARESSVLPETFSGWLDPLSLPMPLQQAIARLDEGEVFGPIWKDESEYLFVGLAARRPLLARGPAEAREAVEAQLRPGVERRLVSEWLANQRAKAAIVTYVPRSQAD